jgi:hypothetical protein
MGIQIAYASGSFTGASTFKTTETGAGALALARNSTATLAQNANISSPAFTITNAVVIEGVLLWLAANTFPTGGTLLVELQKSAVTQASVTVNMTDLPLNAQNINPALQTSPGVVLAPIPLFFRFTGTATGDGTANWTIKLTASNVGGEGIIYYRNSGTAGDFTRALRTSTPVTLAAADDPLCLGELTGAGTHTSFAITMDQTSGATTYGSGAVNSTTVNGGGLKVGCYCSLTYGTTAATQYYLRLNGDLDTYWQGTFSGNLGARSNKNILEMVMTSASGDFGIQPHNMSTFLFNGLSRTAGLNVTKTKLSADVVSANVGTFTSTLNGSNAATSQPDAYTSTGLIQAFTDNTTNGNHTAYMTDGSSRTGVTQTHVAFLERALGANNRYVRMSLGNTGTAALTNGFYADVDLQAGTITAPTAVGNGTATGSSITPCGTGFVCRIWGIASSLAVTPVAALWSCSALGTTSYAGAGTTCFNWSNQQIINGIYTDTAINIADNCGWLAGDACIVASTTRTWNDCADMILDANATSSAFTTALPPFGVAGPTASQSGTWQGTAPFIAEVGLLTHYCQIRSASTTLWGYFYAEPLATVTISWCEFYYLGANISHKYGVVFQDAYNWSVFSAVGGFQYTTGAAPHSLSFCSFHDMYMGVVMQPNNFYVWNLSVSQCVVWNTTSMGINLSAQTGSNNYDPRSPYYCTIQGAQAFAIQNTDTFSFDNQLVMRASYGFWLFAFNVTMTNCTAASCPNYGWYYVNSNNVGSGFAPDGFAKMQNNTSHSNGGYGLAFNQGWPGYGAFMNGFTIWRNNNNGIWQNGTDMTEIVFANLVMFGNVSPNWQGQGYKYYRILGGSLSGDVLFAVSQNIGMYNFSAGVNELDLVNVDFSGVGAGLAPSTTYDIYGYSPSAYWQDQRGLTVNVKWGAPSNAGVGYYPRQIWTQYSYMAHQRYNGVAGDHRYDTTQGQLQTDSVIFRTAAPSMRMTPYQPYQNAGILGGGGLGGAGGNQPQFSRFDYKLTSAGTYGYNGRWGAKGFQVACQNGLSVNVGVYVRAAACSDGVGSFWNPADRNNANCFLSNNNLTVKSNQLSQQGLKTNGPGRTTGLLYAELTMGSNVGATFEGVGITGQATAYGMGVNSNYAALSALALVLFASGHIWFNGVDTGINLGSFASSVVGVAIDFTHQTAWFRIGAGNWNGNATYNPATNVGGINVAAVFPSNPAYLMWTSNVNDNVNNSCTVNTGGSAFANAAPSGFASWDANQALYGGSPIRLIQKGNAALGQPGDIVLQSLTPTPGVWTQLSGTSSVANDNGVWEFVVDCDAAAAAPYGFVNIDDWSTS